MSASRLHVALCGGVLDSEELQTIELEINEMVRERKLRTFQGLVLRNAIETRENEFKREPLVEEE